MKKFCSMLSVVVLFTLWGCQTDSISDTYWRNNQTGEWLIGFTEGKVVYDCKVWDIISQTDKEGAYTILAENNGERLVVKMEPDVMTRHIQPTMRKGKTPPTASGRRLKTSSARMTS